MTTYAWPADILPSRMSFFLESNTLQSVSPLSRASQVQLRQGDRWVCRMEFENLSARMAGRLDAFIAQLDGPGGQIALWDYRRPVPFGAAGQFTTTLFSDGTRFTDGTGFADGASAPVMAAGAEAGAQSLPTSGWQAGATVLLAGDYIGVGDRLHMVLNDITSTAGGLATLRIRPRLRAAVAAGAVIQVVRPTTRFRLADNAQADNRTVPGTASSYALTLLESLP